MSAFKDVLKAGVVVIGLVAVGWFLLGDRTSHQSATLPKEFGAGHIKGGPLLGCTDEADLKRVLHYFVQGDKAAATKAMTDLVELTSVCDVRGQGEGVHRTHWLE